MRNTNPTKRPKNPDVDEIYWRRRPSEIRGYNRAIYTTTENSEYIRIDYNLSEKKVRLYLEDNEEGGNPYYSVIANGRITLERNATTGRVTDLYEKFFKRADVFSTIPNKEVLRLMGNNYGIGVKDKEKALPKQENLNKGDLRVKETGEIRKKYFVLKPEYEPQRKQRRKKSRTIGIIDVIDVLIGIALCFALYSFNRNYVTLGVLSAFIGIFIGLLDVYYRERRLILIKMLLFLFAGIIFYIYGYYIL